MKITSTYSVRLRNFNLVFDDTVEVYRRECQDFCVWGGYSRGNPTRLPFVFL